MKYRNDINLPSSRSFLGENDEQNISQHHSIRRTFEKGLLKYNLDIRTRTITHTHTHNYTLVLEYHFRKRLKTYPYCRIMPTFASIGLHPDLHDRIVAQSSSLSSTSNRRHSATATTSSTTDVVTTVHSDYHIITTPMAFLNRNPKQQLYLKVPVVPSAASQSVTDKDNTSTLITNTHNDDAPATYAWNIRPISLHQTKRLRYEMAVACIQQSMKVRQPTEDTSMLYPNNTFKRQRTTDAIYDNTTNGKSGLRLTTFTGMIQASDIIQQDMVRISSPQYSPYIPTGCHTLDQQLLNLVSLSLRHTGTATHLNSTTGPTIVGGIPLGHITQISGPPASGKTQLVWSMIASSMTATTTSVLHSVYYIGDSYSHIVRATQRLYELFAHSSLSSHDRIVLLQRIVCTVATTSYQVLHRLQEFEAYLQSKTNTTQQEQHHKYHSILLVIDSCSSCCSDSINDGSHMTVLRVIGQMIRRLTRQYHIATILVNGTVSNTHQNTFPVFGGIRGTTMNQNNEDATITSSSVTKLYAANSRTNKPALGYRWNATIPDICLWFQPCSSHDKLRKHLRVMEEETNSNSTRQPNKKAIPTIIQVTVDRYLRHESTDVATTASSIYFSIDKKGVRNVEILGRTE